MNKSLDKLLALELNKPGFYLTTVRHDAWCNKLAGGRECNCDPDVEVHKELTDELIRRVIDDVNREQYGR